MNRSRMGTGYTILYLNQRFHELVGSKAFHRVVVGKLAHMAEDRPAHMAEDRPAHKEEADRLAHKEVGTLVHMVEDRLAHKVLDRLNNRDSFVV